ncbi:Rep_fac-A_C domain-containing protein [Raphanus sativus]|nr:Rep_fac-A_C domain-containing protein [Raphanus sativus]
MCAKCGNTNVAGVEKYLAKIYVYDNNEQAVFVLLGDAGHELTGKHAAELVDNYSEALVHTIGQTHNFRIKVSDYNTTGKIQGMRLMGAFCKCSLCIFQELWIHC